MINVFGDGDFLFLEYSIEYWFYNFHDTSHYENGFDKVIAEKGSYKISGTFRVASGNYEYLDEETILVKIGESSGEYYKLYRDIFDIDYDFYFQKGMSLKQQYFAKDGCSIIKLLIDSCRSNIFVDKNKNFNGEDKHIPLDDYKNLCGSFPTPSEIDYYKKSTIYSIISNYVNDMPNYMQKYDEYINKHRLILNKNYSDKYAANYQARILEFEALIQELKYMVSDNTISESSWQTKIIDLLPLLYPNYILFLPKVRFKALEEGKYKEADFLAVNNDGYVDVIEIKKASIGSLLSKGDYRGNYHLSNQANGTISQVEKYIYVLESNKLEVEKDLNKRFANELNGLTLKILHPKGIIIAGKNNLNERKIEDFEITRRMFKNVIDIYSYDMFIERIENIVKFYRRKYPLND